MPSGKDKLRELNERAERLRSEADALSAEVRVHLQQLERGHLHLVTDEDNAQSA